MWFQSNPKLKEQSMHKKRIKCNLFIGFYISSCGKKYSISPHSRDVRRDLWSMQWVSLFSFFYWKQVTANFHEHLPKSSGLKLHICFWSFSQKLCKGYIFVKNNKIFTVKLVEVMIWYDFIARATFFCHLMKRNLEGTWKSLLF